MRLNSRVEDFILKHRTSKVSTESGQAPALASMISDALLLLTQADLILLSSVLLLRGYKGFIALNLNQANLSFPGIRQETSWIYLQESLILRHAISQLFHGVRHYMTEP